MITTETKLRKAAVFYLGNRSNRAGRVISDKIWGRLIEDHRVSDALDDLALGVAEAKVLQELANAALILIRRRDEDRNERRFVAIDAYRERAGASRPLSVGTIYMNDYELEYREALSEYQAKLLSAGYWVRDLRLKHLGTEEALTSHALAEKFVPTESLLKACSELAGQNFWDKKETLWYILTDEPPLTHGIRATESCYNSTDGVELYELTLHIQPWVSVDSVRRTYESIQQGLFGARRPPSGDRSNLAVFRFVNQYLRRRPSANDSNAAEVEEQKWQIVRHLDDQEAGYAPDWFRLIVERPSWGWLTKQWNKIHTCKSNRPGRKSPGDKSTLTQKDARNLRRAYMAGLEAIDQMYELLPKAEEGT
jgi:hypothetical protein